MKLHIEILDLLKQAANKDLKLSARNELFEQAIEAALELKDGEILVSTRQAVCGIANAIKDKDFIALDAMEQMLLQMQAYVLFGAAIR